MDLHAMCNCYENNYQSYQKELGCVCFLSWVQVWHYMRTSLLLQEPLFAARVVYDLLFYFIVIIIVLNLIFGVIIDTFADLRSEKQKKEEILKTTCFICGMCSGVVKLEVEKPF